MGTVHMQLTLMAVFLLCLQNKERKKERKKKKGNTQLVIRPTKYCFLLYLKRFAVQ